MPLRAVIFLRRRMTSGGARRARSRRCAGRITLAMFEPRLPFEEDIEHVTADTTEQVRLKADTTERDEAVGVRGPHQQSMGTVRLQADDINIGSVRLSPSREATADRQSLGGGGQPDGGHQPDLADADARRAAVDPSQRSEERRVGQACWSWE